MHKSSVDPIVIRNLNGATQEVGAFSVSSDDLALKESPKEGAQEAE